MVIHEEMKMGLKGQVVVPKIFRKLKGLHPGSTVVFELRNDEIIIHKPETKTEEIFAAIANKVHSFEYDSDKAYDEVMTERAKRKGYLHHVR